MPNASTYKVTFAYGATDKPYSKEHPHSGEDRKMPVGEPVDVGNTIIGLSGNTGKSTGPHLHIQKVANGVVVSPQGAGLATSVAFPARVFATGYNKDTIGNFIRLVDAKGVQWSYFHLSKINVTLNQVIGANMDKITKEMEMSESYKATGSYPGKDYSYPFVGTTDYSGMLTAWQERMRLITTGSENSLADKLASLKAGRNITGYIGKDYNSQFTGKPEVFYQKAMEDFWISMVAADTSLAPSAQNPVEKEKARKYDITREALGIV